jgi:hypothetical protein
LLLLCAAKRKIYECNKGARLHSQREQMQVMLIQVKINGHFHKIFGEKSRLHQISHRNNFSQTSIIFAKPEPVVDAKGGSLRWWRKTESDISQKEA